MDQKYQRAYWFVGILTVCVYILRYIQARQFWLDECFLLMSVHDFDYMDLFRPLTYAWHQAAPPLFLVICKFIYSLNILSVELSYRLYSLIAGIGSVIIFIPFVKKFIKDNKLILLSYILYCSNFWVAYYTQEFKPYASDVFWGMATFLLCEKWLRLDKSKITLFLSGWILGSLSFLSQITMFIVLAYLGVLLILKTEIKIKPRVSLNWIKLRYLIIIGIGWIIPVLVMMYLQYYHNPNTEYMHFWWNRFGGFIKPNLSSISNWYFKNFQWIYPSFSIYLFYTVFIILFSTFSCQILCVFQKKKINFQYLFLSLLFMELLLAGLLKVYPVKERVILWTLPFLIMVIMSFMDRFNQYKFNKIIKFILIIVILNNLFLSFCFVKPIALHLENEERTSESILILKKHNVIPVVIKAIDVFPRDDAPDYSSVYQFYKKIYQYQPAEEIILDAAEVVDLNVDEYFKSGKNNDLLKNKEIMKIRAETLRQESFKGKFISGKTYGFIGFEDRLSKECQSYFWQFNGKMEGPVYIWTQP